MSAAQLAGFRPLGPSLACILLATLALAGCAGSGPQPVLPPQDDEGRFVIQLTTTNRFVPAEAQVPVGSVVVWVNGAVRHDVNAKDGAFSSGGAGSLGPEEEFEFKFDVAGTYSYVCLIHESVGMVGKLTVAG